jgi:plastocyanin
MIRTQRIRPFSAPLAGGILVALLQASAPAAAQQVSTASMNLMDHGPFASSTITIDPYSPRGIIAHKAIAVRLGSDATMAFDTDLLRVVGAWTGGFLHWLPARDALQEWPTPDGHLHFLNAEKAGWSTTRNLNDSRASPTLNNSQRYGPLSGDRRYDGLHVQGDDVVFSLSVGGARILEKFGFQRVLGQPVFTRTINVSPTDQSLTLLVVSGPVGRATRMDQVVTTPGAGYVAIRSGEDVRLIGFRGLPTGIEWSLESGHLALSLPAHATDLRFELAIGPLRSSDAPDFMRTYLETSRATLDLTPFLEPGPAPYPVLETQARMGVSEHGAFAVDELLLPRGNPWASHMRLAAIDFLSDGRAVVASMSGDVWLVEGIQENLSTLRWRRFATGLNQPLGLVVVDDVIHVNGRDQITRLHDRNGDGYADHYENFNNAVMAGTNFHAFNLNLEVDSQGRFVWAKATPWAPGNPADLTHAAEITPHHGVVFRLSPDGREMEIIATGVRNPNGLSIGPNDEIYYADNEGNWGPTSKVTRIVEGGFHGFVPSAQRADLLGRWSPPSDWVKPLVWMPHAGPGSDNSPSQPRVITNPAWPAELQGHLLLSSYGRGNLSLILQEEVDGQPQAAHMVLPLSFESGLQHMRFHRDGHLYLVGMTNWQSTNHGGEVGSLHRMRYTGKPLHLPVAVNTREGGLELRFAEPLDRASATNLANFRLSKWTYTWNSSYGSRQGFFSVDRPGQIGVDTVTVRAARLSDDGRTVFLDIPSLRPGPIPAVPITGDLPDQIEAPMGMLMQIDYDIRAADGTQLEQLIHKTIHRVPNETGITAQPDPEPVASLPAATTPRQEVQPGVRGDQAPTRETGRVVVVRSEGTELAYRPDEIRATAGETLTIRYDNVGEMIHNLVIVRSDADIPVIGNAAFQAAFTNEWIPTAEEHRRRMIAYTPLVDPGKVVEVTFTVPPAGEYPFICTYASHWTVMRGRLIVTP